MNPYKVDGPAVISFSGGRTSGLMLARCVEAGLGPDVHVLFANTGKEFEETLVFVDRCARDFGVHVHWVEYPEGPHDTVPRFGIDAARAIDEDPHACMALANAGLWLGPSGCREVNFTSASRRGEPFEALIAKRKFAPNPVARFCTQELKIRVMRDWMRARGYEHWTNVVGLRADEPRRVAKRESSRETRWDLHYPLYDAGVTVEDVRAFWRCQPFDLELQPWEGNCDLCFLKGRKKRERIMRDRPESADWWIAQEEAVGRFRADAPPYRRLKVLAEQPMLPFADGYLDGLDDLGDCECDLEAA